MQQGLKYFVFVAILFLIGCDGEQKTVIAASPETWFSLKVGDIPVEAQLAITLSEKRKGLMYRETLAPDHGMLFPYKSPGRVDFWMANTPLPLDLGLFDGEGVLREIHRLVPHDTTTVTSRSRDIQYALEMNSGWFGRHKLFPGTQLDLELLGKALTARGENPGAYGLPEE